MNRRELFSLTAAGAASQLVSTSNKAEAATPKKALMKLGCQSGPTNEQRLQFFKRHSVNNICGYPLDSGKLGYYTVEESRGREIVARSTRSSLDCIAPPFLASSHIDRTERPAIMLAQSPERDREIERIQNMIKNCAKAGIPSIKYNMSLLGVLRDRAGRQGRGGATLQHLETEGGEDPQVHAGDARPAR